MKWLISIISFTSILFAGYVTPVSKSVSAFSIPTEIVTIYTSYNLSSSNTNIYRNQSNHDSKYGYINGLSSLDFYIGYGLKDHISVYYNFEGGVLDYFSKDLTNIKNEIFVKINFYDVPHYVFDSLSIDIGLSRNSANNFSINSPNLFKNMINKIKPNIKDISFVKDKIYYKDRLLTNQIDPKSGIKVNPSIYLSDLNDNSIFTKIIVGNRFSNALLNLYLGIKYSDVNTKISLLPKNTTNKNYIDLKKDFGSTIDLKRSEKSALAGINMIFESENFIYNLNYEYIKIFGRGYNDINNHNNIFDIDIAYKATKNLLLFAGTKLMLNQYNSIIPYLQNRYSDYAFHNKLGYAKIGFVYNFNLSDLIYNKKLK